MCLGATADGRQVDARILGNTVMRAELVDHIALKTVILMALEIIVAQTSRAEGREEQCFGRAPHGRR